MLSKPERYALIAVLLVTAVFSLDWALKGAIHYKKDVLVPDMTGKSLIEALDLISNSNLGLRKDGAEHDEKVPAGTVLRQIPAPGTQVREGKTIRVVISQGGETAFTPDLAGQSLRSAEIALRTNFLSLGEVRSQPSLKFEKDVVMVQEPAPKTVIPKNSLVHLTVSDGPPRDGTILMPDFVNKNWPDAQSWAKSASVKAEKKDDPAANAAAGTVTAQDQPADAVLTSGMTINFTVSSNPSGEAAPGPGDKNARFHFEVPQGASSKQFTFMLADSFGTREIMRAGLEPGSKHDIPLPAKIGTQARVRIFVDGILTEERSIQ